MKTFYINNFKIIEHNKFFTKNFTLRNIWRTKNSPNSFLHKFLLFYDILLIIMYITRCVYHIRYIHMSRICNIFLYTMVQSYFAIISREWCFSCDMNVISSVRAWRSRKIENIWEMRVILFGKNIIERVDRGTLEALY